MSKHEPLNKPPEIEDGDNTEAAGGTQEMLVDVTEADLEDAPELHEEDVDEDEADDV